MKHHLITAIIMVLSFAPSIARTYDFSAVNDEGVTIYYNITNTTKKECSVYRNANDEGIISYYSGDVVIPSLAYISSTNAYTVTAIADHAFFLCEELTSVTIPPTVTRLGVSAFYHCRSLTSVSIPQSVTIIKGNAFADCTSLKSITSHITDVFEVDETTFKGSVNATLYVPQGTVEKYKATKGWNVFSNIVEMSEEPGTPEEPDIPSEQLIQILLSCSNKGSVSINGSPTITNKIAAADINEGTDNTFTFTPKPGCRLDQVLLNGLDITANVEGNTLTCTIPANSQMIVTFTNEQGDLNNDGRIDISDVVAIVNKILGN